MWYNKNNYTLEDIFPYPFDRSIPMIPFPQNFEIPTFDNYKGKGDPHKHIKEFYLACLQVSYHDTSI